MRKLAPALLICTAILLSGCGTSDSHTTSASTVTEQERPIAVSVQTTQSGDIIKSSSFSGRTKSSNSTSVTAESVGTISKVHVVEGQYVQAGDVLLTIDATDLNKSIEQSRIALETAQSSYNSAIGGSVTSQINQLQNAVANAQLAYDEAKRNYAIYEELYNSDAITEDQFKKIELSLKQSEQALNSAQSTLEITQNQVIPESQALAQKNVEQAKLAYETAQSNLSKLTLTAPTSGTVTAVNFKTGEMISQASPAFIISNLNTLEVELQVTETDIAKFKKGNTVDVTISNQNIKGTVTEVGNVPDQQTNLYVVNVSIDNSKNAFLAGMAADVHIVASQSQGTLIVHKNAVFEEDGVSYVYVCKDNVAVKTPVETGLTTTDTIEISNGLVAGDVVVIEGLSLIKDGTALYPVEKGV